MDMNFAVGIRETKNIKRESLLNLGNENLFLYKVLVLLWNREEIQHVALTNRCNTKCLNDRNARCKSYIVKLHLSAFQGTGLNFALK